VELDSCSKFWMKMSSICTNQHYVEK
jgi:hypothetical protein